MLSYVIVVNDAGELKTITQADFVRIHQDDSSLIAEINEILDVKASEGKDHA